MLIKHDKLKFYVESWRFFRFLFSLSLRFGKTLFSGFKDPFWLSQTQLEMSWGLINTPGLSLYSWLQIWLQTAVNSNSHWAVPSQWSVLYDDSVLKQEVRIKNRSPPLWKKLQLHQTLLDHNQCCYHRAVKAADCIEWTLMKVSCGHRVKINICSHSHNIQKSIWALCHVRAAETQSNIRCVAIRQIVIS